MFKGETVKRILQILGIVTLVPAFPELHGKYPILQVGKQAMKRSFPFTF